MSTVKTVATVLVGLVVLGGGGAYLWSNSSSTDNKETSTTTTTTTTTTESTTKSSESTTSSSTSEETTTNVNQPQSVVASTQQTGAQPVQPTAQVQAGQPAQAPATTVILGKSYPLDDRGRISGQAQEELRAKYAEIEKQKQASQQADLANTALIPNLTPDQPMPITFADIRNANTGWPLKVKGVIEGQLGKPLSSATNKEIQTAVANVAARDGFRDAVKG